MRYCTAAAVAFWRNPCRSGAKLDTAVLMHSTMEGSEVRLRRLRSAYLWGVWRTSRARRSYWSPADGLRKVEQAVMGRLKECNRDHLACPPTGTRCIAGCRREDSDAHGEGSASHALQRESKCMLATIAAEGAILK